MSYVQIWLAVEPTHQDLQVAPGSDQPIKHPCSPPIAQDAELSRTLGAENVQMSTPVFFIEDTSIWAPLVARAKQDSVSVPAVLSAAVQAYLKPAIER